MHFKMGAAIAGSTGATVLALFAGCSSSTNGNTTDAGSEGSFSASSSGGTSSSSTTTSSSGTASSSGTTSSSSGMASSSSGGQASPDAGAQGWCDTIASNMDCIDYNAGFTSADAQADCSTRHGTYSATGSCDRSSSVGGCNQMLGAKVITTWYYAPITMMAAMGECTNDGNATYVAP